MKNSEYSEEKRHGLRPFPIEYYYLTDAHPQYVMPPHWHKEFEILRVISGRFTLYLNNTEHILSDGDVIFYGSEILHRGIPEDCVYECLVFDCSLLGKRQSGSIDGIIAPLLRGEMELHSKIRKEDSDLCSYVGELFETMRQREEYYELRTLSLLFAIFHGLYVGEYIKTSKKKSSVPKQTRIVISTLSWIEDHYNEQITLERLAKVSGLNEKYLCRIFREYTSKSPINYVNEFRIDCACRLMTVEGRTVTQAAYDCGFNDSGYFSKLFRKYKGISPTEYRKTYKN